MWNINKLSKQKHFSLLCFSFYQHTFLRAAQRCIPCRLLSWCLCTWALRGFTRAAVSAQNLICTQRYTTVRAEGNTAQMLLVFFLGISFLQCEKTMNRRICWRYKTRSVSEVTNLRATHCGPQAGTHKKYLCMHVDRVKFSIIALSMSENKEFQPIV